MIHRFRLLRYLQISLVAGALYDYAFAALMATAPEAVAATLGLPLPGEPFYLDLMAVLLVMLGTLYLRAAKYPRRYGFVVLVAILGRLAGALVLGLAAWGRPELASLWVLAGADLAFSALHAAFWWPIK